MINVQFEGYEQSHQPQEELKHFHHPTKFLCNSDTQRQMLSDSYHCKVTLPVLEL